MALSDMTYVNADEAKNKEYLIAKPIDTKYGSVVIFDVGRLIPVPLKEIEPVKELDDIQKVPTLGVTGAWGAGPVGQHFNKLYKKN